MKDKRLWLFAAFGACTIWNQLYPNIVANVLSWVALAVAIGYTIYLKTKRE